MDGGVKLNKFISKSNITKVLSNAQQLGSIRSTTHYDELSQVGIVKFDRVLPANLFSKVALESVITRAEALGCINFQVENLGEEKSAVEWLLTGGSLTERKGSSLQQQGHQQPVYAPEELFH